ncbi:unnamed protein product [Trifolium pratense]|uniref:Uncharacterized protein n=1 Tax=Trifolium pratense TaxID=57577 RepID=A0ACB0J8E3_TRIPR|nr:unnamed protein product [Trifolium pratense]
MQMRKNMTKLLLKFIYTLIIFMSIFLVVLDGFRTPSRNPWPCGQDEDCETKACHRPLTRKCISSNCDCVKRAFSIDSVNKDVT